MKTITTSCLRAIVAGGLLSMAGLANAQTTVQTMTTSAGTVSTFSPDTISVQTQTASSPVSYSFSKTTTYVDENGNPVSVDVVKSGVPVTVYYTQDGDRMVASKVVVRKIVSTEAPAPAVIEKKTTTTTTSPSSQ
jgi:hypothetical protein